MSSKFKEVDPKTLKKLHEVEVEILDEIDRICKKNNIEYFLIGGTLLGAVRHKGFIPWDDDLDIAMTRKNYERFIDVAKSDLDKKYYLDNYLTNLNTAVSFTKIRKNNTLFDEASTKNLNNHKGIFVDIFPFDNIKNKFSFTTRLRALFSKQICLAIFKKQVKNKDYSIYQHPFMVRFLSLMPLKSLFKIQHKLCIINKEDSKYIASFVGSYAFMKECMLKSELFPLKKIEFEGKKYPVFKNYDLYLSNVYGDYMELPPIEQRVNHSALQIEFEKVKK